MSFIDTLYTRLGVPPKPKPNTNYNNNVASLTHTASVPSTTTAGSIPSTAPALRKLKSSSTTFDPAHKYVTSPIFRHPLAFAFVRVLIAVYGVATIVVTLFVFAIRDKWAQAYLSFFTYLTFIGITAYYVVASVHTVSYYLAWRRRGAGAGYLLQRAGRYTNTSTSDDTSIALHRTATRTQISQIPATPVDGTDVEKSADASDAANPTDEIEAGYPQGQQVKWWGRVVQALHVVLASTVVTYPVIVTVVFWSLLAGDGVFKSAEESYTNISVHALNALFGLVEMVFSNSPPIPWVTLPFGLLGLTGYLGVAYITRATQGFYTYAFLDPAWHSSPGMVALYVFGICVAEIVVFSLVRGVMVLRERWAVKGGRVVGVRGGGGSRVGGGGKRAGGEGNGVGGEVPSSMREGDGGRRASVRGDVESGERPSPAESETSRVVTASEGEGSVESWERV